MAPGAEATLLVGYYVLVTKRFEIIYEYARSNNFQFLMSFIQHLPPNPKTIFKPSV